MNMSRILVVDDDQDLLDIISYFLTENGYDIATLATGEAVFGNITEYNPDLILMDVMLAGMDGREICKLIKTKFVLMPVILMSGTHDLALSIKQTGGPNDYLAKPFDLNVLLNKIAFQLTT